jgi:hypothetical protein
MNSKDLINAYIKWLRQNTTGTEVGSVSTITLPFLDSHFDHLQIYIERSDGGFVLTDAGNSIGDLDLQGCDLSTIKESETFRSVVNAFGIRLSGDALVIEATHEDFGKKLQRLMQAMLVISWLCFAMQGGQDEHAT